MVASIMILCMSGSEAKCSNARRPERSRFAQDSATLPSTAVSKLVQKTLSLSKYKDRQQSRIRTFINHHNRPREVAYVNTIR